LRHPEKTPGGRAASRAVSPIWIEETYADAEAGILPVTPCGNLKKHLEGERPREPFLRSGSKKPADAEAGIPPIERCGNQAQRVVMRPENGLVQIP